MNKERPILFSGEMVRAILDGRKSQTRRVAKVRDCGNGMITPLAGNTPRSPQEHVAYCPYGVPGDRLWVRETWAYGCAEDSGEKIAVYRADLKDGDELPSDAFAKIRAAYRYNRWRPSIHMPRWASRINLEVTNVRVEQVTDITPGDCLAEGIPSQGSTAMKMKFADLWDSINEKRGFAWYRNPWVWVIEFSRSR